jgi:hypothetical protein
MIQDGILSIPGRIDKSKYGRSYALTGPLVAIIEGRRVRKLRRFGGQLIFHRTSNENPGQPIKSYIKMFQAAAKEAGITVLDEEGNSVTPIPYDLRRSAIRNMVRAGIREEVARR